MSLRLKGPPYPDITKRDEVNDNHQTFSTHRRNHDSVKNHELIHCEPAQKRPISNKDFLVEVEKIV